MAGIKLAIVGSRSFNDYDLLERTLLRFFHHEIEEVISGGAMGADKLAAKWAEEYSLRLGYKIKLTEYLPDWSLGKKAGPLRNEEIVKKCDMLLCFWDGESKGTASSLSIAKRLKKPTLIIYF